jgi:hypothetical protein
VIALRKATRKTNARCSFLTGNAKIDGLVDDLNLTGNKFNIALAIFYVPYICVDVPSNLVLKYFKAGHYLPFLLTSWGLCATFMGFVTSYGGLLAVSSHRIVLEERVLRVGCESEMLIFGIRHDSSSVSARVDCSVASSFTSPCSTNVMKCSGEWVSSTGK